MSSREILNQMLSSVDDTYDKSDGSFIYNSLKPVAEQLVETDVRIQDVKDKLSIENLSGEDLGKRVNERTGIERKRATYAIGVVKVTGNGTIHLNDLFETNNGVQFRATESKQISLSGVVRVQAVKPGVGGNVPVNTIRFFPVTLSGFTAVTNEQPSYDGFEAESDADLLQRYYDRIRTPATSGNIYHYLNWAKEVSGVGGARVIPLWDGDNTVKVIVIDSEKHPASQPIVDAVQQYIDPEGNGSGNGVAPIGARCTVVSSAGVGIHVTADIVLTVGSTLQTAKDNFTLNLSKYLAEIAFVKDSVSFAQIGSILLATEGISDYENLLVNDGTSNISIQLIEVAVPGVITLNA